MADSPELQQLLALSRDRTAYSNPLYQAVTQMAYRGLPTYAREGTNLSGTLSNQAPPASGGGGMNPALAAALGASGMGALDALMGGKNGGSLPIQQLINGLKKLFGGGQDTVQGDKPYSGGALTGPGFDNSFAGWGDLPSSDPFADFGPMSYPSDPSGGTGVGPGMQAYRGVGGGGDMTDEEYWLWNLGGHE